MESFEEANKIFKTMSKQHRDIFTPHNNTGIDLPHFIGLIQLEVSTLNRITKMSDYFQREHRLKADRNGKECGCFSQTIICQIIKLYRSKRILDFCAGWGDRLIGAMSLNDKIHYYYGIDPNSPLHTGYENMIKSYLSKDVKNKYQLIDGCAEDVISGLNKTFDLVMTSPPYFDLEVYSDLSTQSINRYPLFEDWFNKFLISCLVQSISKLEKNGILAININNTKTHNIVDRLIEYKLPDVTFLGIIYYGDQHRYKIFQPILIWQKT